MALIHRWLMNEGTGNTLEDAIGSLDFSVVAGDNIFWGSGLVRGVEKSFITLASDFVHATDGLVKGTWTDGNLTTFTIAMLCRCLRIDQTGTVIRGEAGTFRLRTWGNAVDITTSNDTILTEAQIPYTWNILILVVNNGAGTIDVYVENVEDANRIIQINRTTTISNGVFRLLGYNDSSFPGTMEIADLAIYNTTLNETERQAYKDLFATLPANFSWRQEGDNFGGVSRHVESGSTITLENNTIKGTGDGLTCQIAVRQQIPYNMAEVWMEAKFFFPTGFTANHSLDDNVNFISLQEDNQTLAERVIAVLGLHTLPGNQITLDNLVYRNSIGSNNVALDGTVITENEWHTVKAYINFTSGAIRVWYDGVLKANLTGLTLDVSPKFYYTGLAYGIHPEAPVDHFYMKDIYVGQVEYVPPSPPTPTPPGTGSSTFEKSTSSQKVNSYRQSSTFEKEVLG